ncbi:acetate/propionate family kinase [Cocleimonas flava]|uniref:Acetate kinase n=1 Tax=Cocleimonas flava TaxID=634765 RepID=A0A4R1EY93_9GAMM|nr:MULTISPECIES: acetate/propionate family kinase [Cocleimonas]MEB8432280.1 acetate/propionate family kinase [Cocleimonas sp. KMM 6892]MEC4714634.1 acetate/propionate family kinase [Cocleimonas sp. KMM 6895]MEC4744552.1 acetate/propionate family kinase [Cocleimonas sp. KMM 6896]TCJ86856.1 acetate kinase [Cocleimonas flava]
MIDVILVVNSGSSSLKFALYPVSTEVTEPLMTGKVIRIGSDPKLMASIGDDALTVTEPFTHIPKDATHEWLITNLLERLYSRYVGFHPVAAGHRVVHGGSEFHQPIVINDENMEILKSYIPLAPLHQQHCLAAIQAITKNSPELPQIACFDTAFHHTQNRLEKIYAIPRKYTEDQLIRYGFHGISYQYIASCLTAKLGPKAKGRVIVAHLGNGASMCAMHNKRSVATSMGFSTLDGLIMGTRSGSIDAGLVLNLMNEKGLSAEEVQEMLYRQSGLLGVSGISNNMRVLAESDDPKAHEAIELFCYRAVKEIGSQIAVLGGLDAIVFTAGIGENSAQVRKMICEPLAWLGVKLDNEANEKHLNKISSEQSTIDVHIIPTNEQAMIAISTSDLINT